ncbi:MAG: nickel-dependent hydrogenase large subunit [Candidatus Heimdallarchaeota archaeon]
MSEIIIDSVTRIEGHLSLKVKVENEEATDAHCKGTMWRGFEKILIGRDPRDAPVILSRVCGVCHEVHRIASTLALEDAAGITPTDNAIRIRNIVEGVTTIYSHAASLLVLSGPDFGVYGLAGKEHPNELELDTEKYSKLLHETILPTQMLCHEVLAMFGGKVPHHMTSIPGGVTTTLKPDTIALAILKVNRIKEPILTVYNYIHDEFIPHLKNEHPELVDLLLNIGVGVRNFLSYGVYPEPEDNYKLYLRRGVIINGEPKEFNRDAIVEHVKYSRYSDDSGGKPSEAIPPIDKYDKVDAYSWIKAPRYNGNPCEVGPLARMRIAGLYNPLSPKGASLLDRLLARLEEAKILVDKVLEWITTLNPREPVYKEYMVPNSGTGVGLWEAPRGALGHWITISNGKIERYHLVVPTTLNASPRDDAGRSGPMEEAIIGAPVPRNEDPINVLRIVRSFDPCLACAIHLIGPKQENTAEIRVRHL